MTDQVKLKEEVEVISGGWDPEAEQRCIVCNQPSGGKAICGDRRCALELAEG